MARFDEIFDEMIAKAKEVASVAGEKTSEIVEVGRLKYKQKQVSSQLEKTYAKLGAVVYESKKTGDNYNKLVDTAIEEITALNKLFDQIDEEIALVGTVQKKTNRKTAYKNPKEQASCKVCNEEREDGTNVSENGDISEYTIFDDTFLQEVEDTDTMSYVTQVDEMNLTSEDNERSNGFNIEIEEELQQEEN